MAHPRKHLVILTGAGISAESGLKTFRDSDGLWNGYDVYEVASPRGWAKDPQLVLEFYNMRRKEVAAAQPNQAHRMLAAAEAWLDITIITQNIDDLHERAGSSRVVHLHGEIFKMRSVRNNTPTFEILSDIHLGDLAPDGQQLRPFIVWFEEPVPMMEEAAAWVQQADLFAVIGTSLQVYPAASLIHYTRKGIPLCILDKKIPSVSLNGVHCIEQTAVDGMQLFYQWLRNEGIPIPD